MDNELPSFQAYHQPSSYKTIFILHILGNLHDFVIMSLLWPTFQFSWFWFRSQSSLRIWTQGLQEDGSIIVTFPLTWDFLKSNHEITLPSSGVQASDIRDMLRGEITWSQTFTPKRLPTKDCSFAKPPSNESCSWPSTKAPPPRILWPLLRPVPLLLRTPSL